MANPARILAPPEKETFKNEIRDAVCIFADLDLGVVVGDYRARGISRPCLPSIIHTNIPISFMEIFPMSLLATPKHERRYNLAGRPS